MYQWWNTFWDGKGVVTGVVSGLMVLLVSFVLSRIFKKKKDPAAPVLGAPTAIRNKKYLGNNPIISACFLGRDRELGQLRQSLLEGRPVLVHGEGGLGKTTLASHYSAKYEPEYQYLAWCYVGQSIADALHTLKPSLESLCAWQADPRQSYREQAQAILEALAQLPGPCLLVLDNANDSVDLEEWSQSLRSYPRLHRLITSRIARHGDMDSLPLPKLDSDLCLQLFCRHHPAAENYDGREKELLRQVFQAIGYNTLVVELLAKNMAHFNTGFCKRYTVENLLADLRSKGLLHLSQSQAVRADYGTLAQGKPEDIIRAMYSIASLSIQEKMLLALFALLPAEGIPFAHLQAVAPYLADLDKLAMRLHHKGWLEHQQEIQGFRISPVVQAVVLEQARSEILPVTRRWGFFSWTSRPKGSYLLRAVARDLTDRLAKKLEHKGDGIPIHLPYAEAAAFARYAESLWLHGEKKGFACSVLAECLGLFFNRYGIVNKSIIFLQQFLAITEELHKSAPQDVVLKLNLSVAYLRLGDLHLSQGAIAKAQSFFESFFDLSKELYESNPQDVGFKQSLSVSYGKLGDLYLFQDTIEKAQSFLELSFVLKKELCESNPQDVVLKHNLSVSYGKLGDLYLSQDASEKAQSFLESSLVLDKELCESNPQDVGFKQNLSLAYGKLGDLYLSQGAIEKAQPFLESSLVLDKELCESNPQDVGVKQNLSVAYERLGNLYLSQGAIAKAQSCFESFFSLAEELHRSNPQNVDYQYNLSESHEKLGEVYYKQQKEKEALEHYQKGWELASQAYATHPQLVLCAERLAHLCEKLGAYYQPSDAPLAKEYWQKAHSLWSQLVERSPLIVQYSQHLAITLEKLKGES